MQAVSQPEEQRVAPHSAVSLQCGEGPLLQSPIHKMRREVLTSLFRLLG